MTEFYLWGTKKGTEDIIRINGELNLNNLKRTKKIKKILEKRGDFEKLRIQKIDLTKMFNFTKEDLKSQLTGDEK